MYLLEKWAGIKEWDVEIISSDIDTSILRRARAGRYSPRSVQYVPEPWLKKYFKSVGDEYQLCDDLRQAVEFTRVNLAEPADTLGYRNFDVIFCRNLLIYFDDASRKTASDTFYEALNSGRISLPGPFGIHEPHLVFVRGAQVSGSDCLSQESGGQMMEARS
jgi:chemotaxis protein methyltransferase CheR